ncbi:hypothetical protein HAX54_008635 [Datura stramonium]|uniref:Uncharacterized protein n=1 Tax=Datura stramonium TaxID=4076 RepID=A0ABS8TFC6_DATST|nr:hypothetical protein [Datura stramonium]
MADQNGGNIFSNRNMEKGRDVARNGHLGSLSSRQMDSLSAICDTFLPSIDANSLHQENMDDSVIKFLHTSASMNGTPQHVAWMISDRLQHPKLNLCKIALWLLSTRIGTFIICGKASLSSQFPYFQNFSRVSPNKREEIVQSWSCSNFKLIKLLSVALKVLTLLVFFTQGSPRGRRWYGTRRDGIGRLKWDRMGNRRGY